MINKNKLADELTDAFIDYQWRLENPFPLPDESREAKILKYQSDYMFSAKVRTIVSGVMVIVSKQEA